MRASPALECVGDFGDGEERRQHPQDLWREQRAREHVARVARRRRRRRRRARPRVVAHSRRQLDVVGRRARPRRRPLRGCAIASCRARRDAASMPRVGSSRRSTGAPPTATAAIATRCRSPPAQAARVPLRDVGEVRARRASDRRCRRREARAGAGSPAARARTVGANSSAFGFCGDVRHRAGDVDRPRVGVEQAAERAQQRGLSRAVAAEQRDDVAGVHVDARRRGARPVRPASLRGRVRSPGRSPRSRTRGSGASPARERGDAGIGERVRAGVAHGERERIPTQEPAEGDDAAVRPRTRRARRAGCRRTGSDRRRRSPRRCASGAARSRRCSASNTVVPRSSLRRASAASTSSAPWGSSCEVGSSSTMRRRRRREDARDGHPLTLTAGQRARASGRGGARSPSASSASSTRRRIADAGHPEVLEHEGDVVLHPVDHELGSRDPGRRSRRRRRARGAVWMRMLRPNVTTSPPNRPPDACGTSPLAARSRCSCPIPTTR